MELNNITSSQNNFIPAVSQSITGLSLISFIEKVLTSTTPYEKKNRYKTRAKKGENKG
jgi:hypothetical protein